MNSNQTSRKTLIKICGLTRIQDIEAVVEAETDYAGFIFAPSRRELSFMQAAALIRELPASIKTVGVFADAAPSMIAEAQEVTRIQVIQLHGSETSAYISVLRQLLPDIEIWKSLSCPVHSNSDTNRAVSAVDDMDFIAAAAKYNIRPDAWLLDSSHSSQSGGTGMTFSWHNHAARLPIGNIILAGGLNEDNVMDGIKTIRPDCVDCSSGVETAGYKDKSKIISFCRKVRAVQLT